MNDMIDQLQAVLEDRKQHPTPDSYTSSLLQNEDEICKKIGEEAIEVILAAKGQGDQRLIEETADLVYHTLVLLVAHGLSWEDVRQELNSRRK